MSDREKIEALEIEVRGLRAAVSELRAELLALRASVWNPPVWTPEPPTIEPYRIDCATPAGAIRNLGGCTR